MWFKEALLEVIDSDMIQSDVILETRADLYR